MWYQKILSPCLCLVLLWPLTVLAVDDQLPSAAPDVIVIGGDHNYPPYEFLDDAGQPAGFNVELTRAIAEVMGMEVEIRLGPWGEMRRALANGEVDALQGMAFTRERTAEVDFSTPHAMVHQSIWVRKGSPIRKLADLQNKSVIVMRGAVMHDFLLERPALQTRIVPVETLEQALQRLASGEHDAALVAKLPGEYLLGRLQVDNIMPIARPLVAQDYGFAVKKGNRELLARFNEGLALLKASGRHEQIFNRWLGMFPEEGVPWERIVRLGALVVGPLVLILVLVLLWSTLLKRQVALRTAALQREVTERQRAMEELELHQQQLIQADKLSSLGVLVSGVAHEINNPNGLILLNLPQLKRAWNDIQPILEARYQAEGDFPVGWLNYSRMRQEIPEMIDEMQQGAGRIKRIVEDLKDFARIDNADLGESVDLNAVVSTALRLVEVHVKKATAALNLTLEEKLPRFRGNGQRIEQVVVNLVLNACQALERPDQSISVLSGYRPSTRELFLEVRDEGAGIAPEHLPKLTDPFFTTKRETGGTGLGLSVSAGIVKEHGGRLEFDSVRGSGTTVRLVLPAEG